MRAAGSTGQAPTHDEPPPQCRDVVRVQQRQAAPECLDVSGRAGYLVDRGGDEEIGLLEHDGGYRWASGRGELTQPVGLVAAARPELGDEPASVHLDQVGGAPERLRRIDRPARRRRGACAGLRGGTRRLAPCTP